MQNCRAARSPRSTPSRGRSRIAGRDSADRGQWRPGPARTRFWRGARRARSVKNGWDPLLPRLRVVEKDRRKITQFLTLGWEQRVNVSHGRQSKDRRAIRPERERCRGLQGEPESACICRGSKKRPLFSSCSHPETLQPARTDG